MSFLSPIFQTLPYLTAPTLFGWVVWLLLLGVTGYSLYTWRRYHLSWKGRQWGMFFSLLVLAPIAVLLVGYSAVVEPSKYQVPSISEWAIVEGSAGVIQFGVFGVLIGILFKNNSYAV